MEAFKADDVLRIIEIMCDTAERQKHCLTQLDCNVGDGDFGSSLSIGFGKIKEILPSLKGSSIEAILKSCGSTIIDHCGGCTGPIWGGAFRTAGNHVQGKEEIGLDGLAGMMSAIVEKIRKQGGAELGDKTLLDALIPAAVSLQDSASKKTGLGLAVRKAAEVARAGAEGTANLIAKKGRARTLGERTLGHPDPGAMALSFMFLAISTGLFAEAAVPRE